jgi:FtsK/SpoIIIE family
MGPHGLVIGATGSGKSELLRTLVLGLAVTHSSETLNFVLVDFKGGATFSRLDDLPHTSAVITNLADKLPLVDRMKDAIDGELNRRQELLRDAGNYANLKDYEKARENGAPLKPMPSLFVVVDEFSELLTAKPDFIDLFIAIGRIGRSLGVHLLLASQRLEEGDCAAWTPTCRTGSACVRSPRSSPGWCSACRTPTSCHHNLEMATSRSTPPRCCDSRRPTSPDRHWIWTPLQMEQAEADLLRASLDRRSLRPL